ncbi:hypothetical protein FRC10_000490 [Ceratobasidium sp. 414]|nr:hypothetical protein FRC10_000490 [Ceratobasidium sp. 414]
MIIKDQSSAVWQYYEASTDDGASSSRMSHLQPEPDHRPTSPPHDSQPLQAPPSPPRRRLGLTALASTVFVVFMSAGMATFFLLFVILSQVENGPRDKSAFILRERLEWDDGEVQSSTLSALSVSTAISHFLSITTPLVFSLLAYRTAHLWLRAQSSPSADEEGMASRLPTPLHYGLLVRILNSSTILGLGSPAAYFIPRRGRANRANTIPTPRLLREAFAAAFLVYLLSHAVGLADIWLHAVSTVTMADAIADANDLPDFAMEFNSSLCDPTTELPCLTYPKYWGTPPVVRVGSLVAANSTNSMKIGVTTLAHANDTAILVPTDFVREWNFTATTYGARASCQKFSKYCYRSGCLYTDNGIHGPAYDVGMNVMEVISSMYPQAISGSSHSRRGTTSSQYLQDQSRIMAYVGGITVGSDEGLPLVAINATPPNPGPVLMQLRWTDFEQGPYDISNYSPDGNGIVDKQSANPLGHPDNDGDEQRTISTILSQCELEFVRVRYGYSLQNQFVAYDIQGLGGDPDSATLAGILWAPLIWQQMTEQVGHSIVCLLILSHRDAQFVSNMHQTCSVQLSDDSILANLEQELTRLALGSAAGVFVRTTDSVSDASVIKQELVGRYPRTPVFVFAGLLYAYAALAILLFLSTMACTSDVIEVGVQGKERVEGGSAGRGHTALELAHRSLVDPVALIAEQHVWAPHVSPSTASAMSVRRRTAEMFGVGQVAGEEKEGGSSRPERLVVGLGGPYADTGNPRFGVWRRPKRQVEPEYGRGPLSIGSGTGEGEILEGTTIVASSQHLTDGMPPAYASLGRGEYRPTRARSGSELSRGVSEYRMSEMRPVRVDFGRMQGVPEKDLSGLVHTRSSVSSEGSEASGSTARTVRRSTDQRLCDIIRLDSRFGKLTTTTSEMAPSMGSTPQLTPHASISPDFSSYYPRYSPPASRSSTPELSPAEERARRRAIVQPAFFYPNSGADDPANELARESEKNTEDDAGEELLDPAEDPRATRGIPVFRPTLDEFSDFEAYMERVEVWGRGSGIVKVIPPKEWTDGLSSTTSRLSSIKLKHPIEQHMVGKTGLFRQQNEERRHTYSVRDWAALCAKDGLRAPPPREVVQAELNARRSRRARKGEDTAEDEAERTVLAELVQDPGTRKTRKTDAKTTSVSKSDDDFYHSLDPLVDWLPPGTSAADYTPAVCRALERHYWRNCGLGKDPMYGADMQGSLFDEDMTTWNVSCLPSLLTRLLPEGNKIPGVNTPYLYFGMWRATFAWHVEDMDLYSINYIHWGAPKYWYAVPSARANAFEHAMSKHFSAEANECPQFMRHKSFLASPAILAEADCRPNTLVQHQGEFVITYPRGYHAGFNVGFNCAESVNFALDNWVEIGRRAQVCNVHLDVDAILEDQRMRQFEEDYDPLNIIDHNPSRFTIHRKRQPLPIEQPKAKRARTTDGSPPKSSDVVYATAAQLEQLPTIKIKIRPKMLPSLPPVPKPRSPTASYGARVQPTNSSLPRLKLPPLSVLPCCLCASTETAGLLPVRGWAAQGGPGGSKQAHEVCAQAIPETWVAESASGKFVGGIESIVKERWALKCSICTKSFNKAHGAKIQCAKGKCPKAFHVSCARDTTDVEFTVTDRPSGLDIPGGEPQAGEQVRKQTVAALCPQHNPRVVEARKLDKQQRLDADIGALTQYSRIKVRSSGGVFAVTLVNVYEDRRTVEVIWDQGGTKEFRYSSVVWSDQLDGAVQEKPTEVSAQPQPAPYLKASTHPSGKPGADGLTRGQFGSHIPGAAYTGPAQSSSGGYGQVGSSSTQTHPSQVYPFPGYLPNAYAQVTHTYPHPVRFSHTPPSHTPTPPASDHPGTSYSAPFPPYSQPTLPTSQPYPQKPAPMSVPAQHPYSYGYYEQQGYPLQPQFYPAHAFYQPVTTFHAATPPSARIEAVPEGEAEASTTQTPGSSVAPPTRSTASSRLSIPSYVGVRPASSQDILNGAHQPRNPASQIFSALRLAPRSLVVHALYITLSTLVVPITGNSAVPDTAVLKHFLLWGSTCPRFPFGARPLRSGIRAGLGFPVQTLLRVPLFVGSVAHNSHINSRCHVDVTPHLRCTTTMPSDRHRDHSPRRDRRARSLSPSRRGERRSRSLERRPRLTSRSPSPRRHRRSLSPRRSRSPRRPSSRERGQRSRSRSYSPRRRRSRSASSGSSDDTKKKRDKEKEREKKARRREKREKKEKKRSKAGKSGAVTGQWGQYGIINESDLYNKDAEFRTWLVEECKLNPETMSKDMTKKQFAKFVEDYNTATFPHEKFYNIDVYERRMNLIRNGETLPVNDSYDLSADLAAHTSRHKRSAIEHDSYLNREQLLELRRVQNERIEAGKMKAMGLEVKANMGVRMDGSSFE